VEEIMVEEVIYKEKDKSKEINLIKKLNIYLISFLILDAITTIVCLNLGLEESNPIYYFFDINIIIQIVISHIIAMILVFKLFNKYLKEVIKKINHYIIFLKISLLIYGLVVINNSLAIILKAGGLI